jgi:hypothetical protein
MPKKIQYVKIVVVFQPKKKEAERVLSDIAARIVIGGFRSITE